VQALALQRSLGIVRLGAFIAGGEAGWTDACFRYVENASNPDIHAIRARGLTQQVKGAPRGVSLATLDSLQLLEPAWRAPSSGSPRLGRPPS